MGFFQKLNYKMQLFMRGRYGADQLGNALVYGALVPLFLSAFPALGGLNLLALAMLIYGTFRMLSRNTAARRRENDWYMRKIMPYFSKLKQAWVRFKNRKIYRYETCPQCKATLRVPKTAGNVTITCGRCGSKVESKPR